MAKLRKKSFEGFTFIKNLIDCNINNLNLYENQPRYENGIPDSSFVKVRITIEELK